jgi:NAD(P)-dependent dehydrogenase (short-subunit alcohol dehydrogenase family)
MAPNDVNMDVRGKGVLVTGAGRGLGAALSRALARRGAKVVLVARNAESIEAVARSIRHEGGEAHAIAADVGDKRAIHKIAGAAAALVGDIDVLVHNASTLGPVPLRPLLDTDCEDLEEALAVNLVGPFRLTKAIAGSMVVRKTGVVVSISSDAATHAYPTWGAYGASKAALDHLGNTFGAELGAHGVRFFSVDPGEMDTKMHADAFGPMDTSTLARPDDVAQSIVRAIEDASLAPNGSRIEAASLRRAA